MPRPLHPKGMWNPHVYYRDSSFRNLALLSDEEGSQEDGMRRPPTPQGAKFWLILLVLEQMLPGMFTCHTVQCYPKMGTWTLTVCDQFSGFSASGQIEPAGVS